ncbi:Putative G3BP-like protein [Psilocybe cubensis]|uniref:Uncharacterized protein n=2 Tax=Psilocybe cubensis TaxID=181762 RepID=A0A8H7XUT4_PSICU|nr:Putative G3BP-like protein [Psilocybe cubensis]KAH9478430.1 Putative G3BP-like protein [Psilocybe cubensis]
MSSSSTTSSQHQNVVPSEVGWQFVPQYYTFVNKEPQRLHCFYNKNSTFIHGTEGEDMKPCFGQQEIHNKITSIGFEDCKVFIHSVDAQSSANGGIIIQVIGEMSNHGDPWRKFVQTFFLAEQPNGYFVLNDIFRFLKEETVEGDEFEDEYEPASEPATPAQPAHVPEPVHEPIREPTPPPAVVEPAPVEPTPVEEPAPVEAVAEPPTTQTPTPAPEQQQPPAAAAAAPQPNGIHTPEAEKPAPVVTEPSPAPTPAPQQQPAPAPTPAAPAPAPTPAAAPAAPVQPARPAPPVAAAPPPQPAAPAVPRSWASLAASNPKKWGAAVAQESRGTTETLSTQPSSAPAPKAPAPAASPAQRPQSQQQGQQANGRHEHPAYLAVQSVNTAQCFVKGVTEPVSQAALQTTLSSRFGPIKELEIVRAKACAFIEFQSVESAKRAIIASLTQHQGGEGGIWIDVGGDAGQLRISVETKKERGDRPPTRPRGGAPAVNGDGRGSPAGRGRGGGRGGRGGASTPK